MQDRPERAFHHRRHSSVPGPPDGAVSVSVNGGISAKSPDAAAAADAADFSSGAEDQLGAAPLPRVHLLCDVSELRHTLRCAVPRTATALTRALAPAGTRPGSAVLPAGSGYTLRRLPHATERTSLMRACSAVKVFGSAGGRRWLVRVTRSITQPCQGRCDLLNTWVGVMWPGVTACVHACRCGSEEPDARPA